MAKCKIDAQKGCYAKTTVAYERTQDAPANSGLAINLDSNTDCSVPANLQAICQKCSKFSVPECDASLLMPFYF